MIILLSVVVTTSVILLFLNLTAGEKKVEEPITHLYGIESEAFLRNVAHLLGPPVIGGNKITSLINGDEIFPAMLKAIEEAKDTICFETYIYWSGAIGETFSKALARKAKSGVKVHLIIDAVGSLSMDAELLTQMKNAGVEIAKFHPLRWYTLSRMNNRTHRKLLIVDGTIGFTGGVGIADQWLGNADSKEHWRDSHFILEGPAVLQMQAAFMDNWLKTRAVALHGDKYFPKVQESGSSLAQVFMGSANEGGESIRLMYLLSLASAQRTILLSSSYFIPDDLSIQTFLDARKRGVSIEIIVPGPDIDVQMVRRASRAGWGKLLEAGVKIYEYQPTMFHCKVLVIDSLWTSVGSTNFDNRSFRLNAEANLNVYDSSVALIQSEIFQRDKARSNEVTLEAWKNRPISEKITENLSSLLGSQL